MLLLKEINIHRITLQSPCCVWNVLARVGVAQGNNWSSHFMLVIQVPIISMGERCHLHRFTGENRKRRKPVKWIIDQLFLFGLHVAIS